LLRVIFRYFFPCRRGVSLHALHGLAVILLPIAVIAVLRRGVVQASAVTLAYALAAYLLTNGHADLPGILANGLITGLQISSIIFTAIYFYNVQRGHGVEEELKRRIGSQGAPFLYIAVFFSGFVESFSGYGVPPAVVAPLLLSAGLDPFRATVSVVVGHTWAVPLASIGVPTAVLAALTEVDVGQLAAATVVSGSLSLAAIIALVSAKYLRQGAREILPAFALALLFALLGPVTKVYSAAVLGLVGLTLGLVLSGGLGRALETLVVLRYYLLLVLLLLASNLLGFGGLQYTFLVILAAALLSQFLERKFSRDALRRSISMTTRSIIAVVLFAVVAELVKRGGYMRSLALILAEVAGPLYALAVPIVGAVGAYATGSATTSNLIFSTLQKSYADAVGFDAVALLALQNVGGGLGGMVSPAKIAVAASTTGGKELEPRVFREGWRALSVVILPQVLVAALLLLSRG